MTPDGPAAVCRPPPDASTLPGGACCVKRTIRAFGTARGASIVRATTIRTTAAGTAVQGQELAGAADLSRPQIDPKWPKDEDFRTLSHVSLAISGCRRDWPAILGGPTRRQCSTEPGF